MTNKVLLSLATVALFAATANADYTVETTTNWFSVVAADVSLTDNWGTVKPTREDAATVIDVDTSAAAPAKYTPPAETKPSATRYRVTGNMTVTLNAAVPGGDVFGETLPKAALVAVDDSGTGKWYAWHLTDANHGAWVEMSGDTPVEGNTYSVVIEFTSTTVSYKVGGVQLLTANDPSATLSTVGGQSIASVGLAGYGSFGNFSAIGYEEFEVTVSSGDLTKYGIDGEGNVAAQLDEPGANGYPKWQSIVLGLKDSASQPYLVPVQNTDTGKLSIALGGVAPQTGYIVDYAVEEVATPNTAMSSSPTYDSPTSVDLNAGAVKYYKIKIKITK